MSLKTTHKTSSSAFPPWWLSTEAAAAVDIKSDNIVVDLDHHGTLSRMKIIDLGDSVKIEPTTHHPFTHPTYRAPEGLFGLPWTTNVDIWALGTLVCGPLSTR